MITLRHVIIADSAHIRKFASVTRPFFPIFGWGLGTRLVGGQQAAVHKPQTSVTSNSAAFKWEIQEAAAIKQKVSCTELHNCPLEVVGPTHLETSHMFSTCKPAFVQWFTGCSAFFSTTFFPITPTILNTIPVSPSVWINISSVCSHLDGTLACGWHSQLF